MRRLCRGSQRAGGVLRRSLLGVGGAVGAGGRQLSRSACRGRATAACGRQPVPHALGRHQRFEHVSLVSAHRSTRAERAPFCPAFHNAAPLPAPSPLCCGGRRCARAAACRRPRRPRSRRRRAGPAAAASMAARVSRTASTGGSAYERMRAEALDIEAGVAASEGPARRAARRLHLPPLQRWLRGLCHAEARVLSREELEAHLDDCENPPHASEPAAQQRLREAP